MSEPDTWQSAWAPPPPSPPGAEPAPPSSEGSLPAAGAAPAGEPRTDAASVARAADTDAAAIGQPAPGPEPAVEAVAPPRPVPTSPPAVRGAPALLAADGVPTGSRPSERAAFPDTAAFAETPAARPSTDQPVVPAVQDQPSAPPQPPPGTALGSQSLLRTRRPLPARGWRRLVHRLSGGLVHPGPSPSELRHAALVARARASVGAGCRIAVISMKGGVGKTSTSACLGATLATLREDQVVAVDANPDMGTLAARLPREHDRSLRDLLFDLDDLRSYADVREHTSQGESRLEVLASDQDPASSRSLTEEDYRRVCEVLARYYRIVITDSGTGLLHDAMNGVLGLADVVVLVTTPGVDGARSADATLDWLEAHGLARPRGGLVTVVNSVQPGFGDVDRDLLHSHFSARCRAVVQVPHDPHLHEGGMVEPDLLRPATRQAFLELAATVVDGVAGAEVRRATAGAGAA